MIKLSSAYTSRKRQTLRRQNRLSLRRKMPEKIQELATSHCLSGLAYHTSPARVRYQPAGAAGILAHHPAGVVALHAAAHQPARLVHHVAQPLRL